jgi:hypothetical protein
MFSFSKRDDGAFGLSPRQAFAVGLVTSVLTVGTVGFVLLATMLVGSW